MKRSKANSSKAAKNKAARTYPVAAWMDTDVQALAKTRDAFERHELATKLERQAEQLRGFTQEVQREDNAVMLDFVPNARRALIAFARAHGGRNVTHATDNQLLRLGAMWVVESALTMMPRLSSVCNRVGTYARLEGVPDTNQFNDAIERSFREWSEGKS